MQLLTVTACASGPRKAANSASNALQRGPCVSVWPCSTSRTAFRSSSVIHGRPNGMSMTSVISHLRDGAAVGCAIGSGADGEDIEVEASVGRRGAGDDRLD